VAEDRKALTDGTSRRAAGGPLPTLLDVNLVTPRGVIAHQDTDALTAPGEEGEFELLPGHVAKLTALRPGVLVIGEKTKTKYAVSSGYLRVDPSSAVEVLVDEAVLATDVDVEAARTDLKAAEAEIAKWADKAANDGEYVTTLHRLQWARARLDAAGQH
jgi:F-type H+-transporting ATPase subunit epsilon